MFCFRVFAIDTNLDTEGATEAKFICEFSRMYVHLQAYVHLQTYVRTSYARLQASA